MTPSSSTMVEAVPEGMVRGASEAVDALRAALRAGDVEAVQQRRWLAPRPPGERDLLSDMAAAEGIQTAVRRLSKFWQRTAVRREGVRAVSALEAEIYERLEMPGESLPIVTVVRRDAEELPWKIVCTNEARDERFVVWITVRGHAVDDVAWSRRAEAPGQLLMDDAVGVLGHPERGWLVHVHGPFVPLAWPDMLPGEGGRVLELAMALSAEGAGRPAQLRWIMQAAYAFMDELGGDMAYVPEQQRLILPDALIAAAGGTLLPRHAFRFWAGTRDVDDHVVTQGLGRLGLPEVEAPLDVLSRPELVRSTVERFGATLLASPHIPSLGTELVVGEECVVLVAGRRGPRRGTSYGRFGAFALAPTDNRMRRGSRTRMRIPTD